MASAPVVRVGDPAGSYRRRIRLRTLDAATTDAELEDDFHRFGVTVHHDGAHVVGIEARAGRAPWTTCPAAGAQLDLLLGMDLDPRCTAVAAVTDPKRQCTHQFDLAGLAVAHATRPAGTRTYDVEIPAAGDDGLRVVTLHRDGELLHTWTLGWGVGLLEPAPFTDAPWRGGFIRWADATFGPEEAEAAIVLRRACDIGMGRGMDLEGYRTAAELADLMTGVCFTMQPDVMPVAIREIGAIRDFSDHPDALLSD